MRLWIYVKTRNRAASVGCIAISPSQGTISLQPGRCLREW